MEYCIAGRTKVNQRPQFVYKIAVGSEDDVRIMEVANDGTLSGLLG